MTGVVLKRVTPVNAVRLICLQDYLCIRARVSSSDGKAASCESRANRASSQFDGHS